MSILFEDKYFTFREEDGIICLCYKEKIITLEIAMHGVETRSKLTHHKRCRLYADLTNVNAITKQARDFYATYEAGKLVNACAVYTPSILTKTLVLFFVNFNKPNLPLKSFSSKSKAFKWLKEFPD
jgi:hypothetical protein